MEILTVIIISLITFFTRVINLLNIPIFTDEAIYIRWAQIGLNDPSHRYISLTDGKQPMLTWLMYPMLKIFQDPLFAGRFVSVLSGVLAVVGIYLLTRELFSKKTAVLACGLYIISPFALIYDRLALMDSLLSSFAVWSLYLQVLLVRKLRLDIALILGFVTGLGLLTKSSAFFFIYLLPFSLLLFNYSAPKKITLLFKWLGLILLGSVISIVMYNSLRLSPWFYIINLKNHVFILGFGEFAKHPLDLFIGNMTGLLGMLTGYLTLPFSIFILLGTLWSVLKRDNKILLLGAWFIFPFLSLAAFGVVIFPRFILFMVIPLLIIAAYLFEKISRSVIKYNKYLPFFLLLIVSVSIRQSYLLMFDPLKVDIPSTDRNQLFDDWPSGYGVQEVINYLKQQAEKGKIVVGTEGTFGLNPAVYEIYLGTNKNVEIYGFWPVSQVPQLLLDSAKKYPTYLIFKEKQDIPLDWPLKLIAKYQRGTGKTYLYFYQVDTPKIQ
ncbi:hypothetical protein A3D03_02480 [Candidatus Gottesmanbacteria bacterium RIFCSPHIGHO2_02_FULL_40_13]|uniref:Glycosyltransferase RgtA/B/C/D-like domain-containing protein n=1 Tax=Candidatus Gottesmanbacteria bacterium RIFCSPHIGHO2_02_FULL_40_13 TaxID=1798384 RepID=A0A1F6A9Y3_9BACT|nr:MAG: hypothetical protein A3D03_02480 [Candidatus Gottesmanbacteria bacterium RIFCSPHIGHO2_02_FULL_40_13]